MCVVPVVYTANRVKAKVHFLLIMALYIIMQDVSQARPMTSVKAAGFTSHGDRGKYVDQILHKITIVHIVQSHNMYWLDVL